MIKEYLSISEVAQLLSVTEEWVYKKSKQFDCAKIKLDGKPIKPMRFDAIALRELLSRSLTIERNQKAPQSKSLKQRGDKRLWG